MQVQVDDRIGRDPRAVERLPGGVAHGARLPGRVRAQAQRPVRVDPAVPAVPAPFVDFRRPLRLLHLDLLVLLGFGASHVFFNRGEIDVSVPLVYPVLLYLLVRMLCGGLPAARARRAAGAATCRSPWLAVALVLLVGFRVGAQRGRLERDRRRLRGRDRRRPDRRRRRALRRRASPRTSRRATPTGRSTTCSTCRSSRRCRWSGRWDDLPAAHGAAIAFDLLTLGGLLLLGPRAAAGPRGRGAGRGARLRLGRVPLHAVRARDELERHAGGAGCVARAARAYARAVGRRRAASRSGSARRRSSPRSRWRRCSRAGVGRVVLRGSRSSRRWRSPWCPFVPDGGLRELYDRTIGYQAAAARRSASGARSTSLGWLQTVVKVAAAGAGAAVAFVPRRRERAPGGRAGRGGADRAPAGGHPLVLPLRRVVRAVRARGDVRRLSRTTRQPGRAAAGGAPAPRPCPHETDARVAGARAGRRLGADAVAAARGPTSASTTCTSTACSPSRCSTARCPTATSSSSTRRSRRRAIALPGLAGTGEEAFRLAFAALDAGAGRRGRTAVRRARARAPVETGAARCWPPR